MSIHTKDKRSNKNGYLQKKPQYSEWGIKSDVNQQSRTGKESSVLPGSKLSPPSELFPLTSESNTEKERMHLTKSYRPLLQTALAYK